MAVLAVIGVKRMAGMAKGNSCCSSGDGQRSKPHPGAYRLHLAGSEDIHDHIDGTQHEHGSQMRWSTLRILEINSHHMPAVTTLFAK